MQARVVLETIRGPFKSRAFSFEEPDTFLIGRAADCHAEFSDDTQLSRHHCLLEVRPPDLVLHELGSTNGTFVNNRRCPPQKGLQGLRLRQGDVVAAGRNAFKVVIEIPTICASCGHCDDPVLAPAKGVHLCENCASPSERNRPRGWLSRLVSSSTTTSAPAKSSDFMHCPRCGVDISRQVDGIRVGSMLCTQCRAHLLKDPQDLITHLLEVSTRQGQPLTWQPTRLVATGTMSAVFAARRRTDGADVAVKLVVPAVPVDLAAIELLDQQLQSMEHGHLGGVLYFVSELYPGGNVSAPGRPYLMSEAAPLMQQALSQLRKGHDQGLVHGYLKPTKLLLTASDHGELRIGDLYGARAVRLAGLRGIDSTLDYTARERLLDVHRVLPNADVWSLAASFYFMLTQVPPREPSEENPLAVLLHAPVIPIVRHLPQLSRPLIEVFDKALSDRSANRYADAGAFLTALNAAI
ncbi:MAG: FHA domain-containing protein [Candidatus Xenobia bacterium]